MDDGVQGTLHNMARQYYKGLYTRDQDTKAQPHTWKFPKLKRNFVAWLNRKVTGYEVKLAMMQIGAHKAPWLGWITNIIFSKVLELSCAVCGGGVREGGSTKELE